jgi:hypothetical protein
VVSYAPIPYTRQQQHGHLYIPEKEGSDKESALSTDKWGEPSLKGRGLLHEDMLLYSGKKYQDKAWQIGIDVVEAGRGDLIKTTKAVRGLLEEEVTRTQIDDSKC